MPDPSVLWSFFTYAIVPTTVFVSAGFVIRDSIKKRRPKPFDINRTTAWYREEDGKYLVKFDGIVTSLGDLKVKEVLLLKHKAIDISSHITKGLCTNALFSVNENATINKNVVVDKLPKKFTIEVSTTAGKMEIPFPVKKAREEMEFDQPPIMVL